MKTKEGVVKRASVKGLIILMLGVVVFLPGLAMANLVVNGGFEPDLSGWTVTLAPETSYLEINAGGGHSGAYGLVFGAYGGIDDKIQQTIIPTTPGSLYTFDFWLTHGTYSSGGFTGVVTGTDNGFHAFWNGTDLLPLIDAASFGWTHYTFTVSATEAFSTIAFSGWESYAAYYLDDISVNAVPLPPTALLLGSGLLGLALLRRKRNVQK